MDVIPHAVQFAAESRSPQSVSSKDCAQPGSYSPGYPSPGPISQVSPPPSSIFPSPGCLSSPPSLSLQVALPQPLPEAQQDGQGEEQGAQGHRVAHCVHDLKAAIGFGKFILKREGESC